MNAQQFQTACDALQGAGVTHAQLRAHYAAAVLEALAGATPTPFCGDRWDEGVTCSLPADHAGWHASSPWYDATRQEVHTGQTWTPRRAGSDYRMCRS